MTTKQILEELKAAGNETTKKIFLKHGAKEPFFGVKIEDLKKIQKKVKENQQQIAMQLFESGIGDAMYLAGLMADGSKMTKKELQSWVSKAEWPMVSEYSVAWVAAENSEAWELALKWIDSPNASIASSGWSTVSSMVATWPDEKLDIAGLKKLLERVEKEILKAPNRVRYCMNAFVIAAGSFVKELNKEAIEVGKKIGSVEVNMGGTSCKVPFAPDYIKKVVDKGYLGRKKKTAKC
ncbi:MAG: DNA alkylation repair protein [Chitinophagaceae bacterium]